MQSPLFVTSGSRYPHHSFHHEICQTPSFIALKPLTGLFARGLFSCVFFNSVTDVLGLLPRKIQYWLALLRPLMGLFSCFRGMWSKRNMGR